MRVLVQEEIRFAVCPELIASRLFTEFLEDNEVMVAYGPERFSSSKGYMQTFKYDGDFQDDTKLDTDTGTPAQPPILYSRVATALLLASSS